MAIENQLHYFLVVARHEHLGRAAEELGLSQPALSRSISRLEKEYGAKLFDRGGRRMRLNAAGKLVLAYAERALAELEDAHRALQASRAEARQTVSIGFLATFGVQLVPDLIRSYKVADPHVQFRLLQGPYPSLRQRLVSGEIDLCIASPRFSDASLDWRPLFEEELVVIVPRGHRLQARGEIDLREIAKEPIIALKKEYGLRQHVEMFSHLAGFTPQIAFEGEEVATLQGLVGAGFGVSLAPKGAVKDSNLIVSLAIREPVCRRIVGLSWRRGRYLPNKTVQFRDHIIKLLHDPRVTARGR